MSEVKHHHHIEHKSLLSYVTGFVLSLIFTILPYNLVVNQTLTGSDLLLAILGFALAQLIVQVVFFLHLGRGPKPNWNLYFFAATIGIIVVVIGGSIIIMNNLHRKLPSSDQARQIVDSEGIYQVGGEMTGACQMGHESHLIEIKNGKIIPSQTIAEKCDTLTFIDKDMTSPEIVFGAKNLKTTYAGMNTLNVRKGHSKTITLSELGTFQFHDSSHPLVLGRFTVIEKD